MKHQRSHLQRRIVLGQPATKPIRLIARCCDGGIAAREDEGNLVDASLRVLPEGTWGLRHKLEILVDDLGHELDIHDVLADLQQLHHSPSPVLIAIPGADHEPLITPPHWSDSWRR